MQKTKGGVKMTHDKNAPRYVARLTKNELRVLRFSRLLHSKAAMVREAAGTFAAAAIRFSKKHFLAATYRLMMFVVVYFMFRCVLAANPFDIENPMPDWVIFIACSVAGVMFLVLGLLPKTKLWELIDAGAPYYD